MKIFIAGSRSISKLDGAVVNRIDAIFGIGATVLVGDAKGVDSLIQSYLYDNGYNSVLVYVSNNKARNNIGNWRIVHVPTDFKAGTYAFHVAKDKKMAEDSDYGLMIWDGISRGTKNDIEMLLGKGKKTALYYAPHHKFYDFCSMDHFSRFCLSFKAPNRKLNMISTTPQLVYQSKNNQMSIFEKKP